jgi:hypothetical protein
MRFGQKVAAALGALLLPALDAERPVKAATLAQSGTSTSAGAVTDIVLARKPDFGAMSSARAARTLQIGARFSF